MLAARPCSTIDCLDFESNRSQARNKFDLSEIAINNEVNSRGVACVNKIVARSILTGLVSEFAIVTNLRTETKTNEVCI